MRSSASPGGGMCVCGSGADGIQVLSAAARRARQHWARSRPTGRLLAGHRSVLCEVDELVATWCRLPTALPVASEDVFGTARWV